MREDFLLSGQTQPNRTRYLQWQVNERPTKAQLQTVKNHDSSARVFDISDWGIFDCHLVESSAAESLSLLKKQEDLQ